ncbi:MAG: polyphosphate polymerase domain-containing protein [Lachnospiraceae bacterium]|nr:polyphosphate polymerase domain-containing protein [Lachnospiraceae bacterium]
MVQEISKYDEKKYLVTKGQYQELVSRMITRVKPGPYGKYLACNVYFAPSRGQTENLFLEEGPVCKEKLRLRSYGVPKEKDTVYIELKRGYDGRVYKRRVPMKYGDAKKYLYYGIRPGGGRQTLGEMDPTLRFYQICPIRYVAYNRIAFCGKEEPGLRLTFDFDIRARKYELELGMGSYGDMILEEGFVLMKVKTPDPVPKWLSTLFSELGVDPVSCFKSGICCQGYMAGGGGGPVHNRNHLAMGAVVDFKGISA